VKPDNRKKVMGNPRILSWKNHPTKKGFEKRLSRRIGDQGIGDWKINKRSVNVVPGKRGVRGFSRVKEGLSLETDVDNKNTTLLNHVGHRGGKKQELIWKEKGGKGQKEVRGKPGT